MSPRTIWILRATVEAITGLLLMATTDATVQGWILAHKGIVVAVIIVKLFASSLLQQSGNTLDPNAELKSSAAKAGNG